MLYPLFSSVKTALEKIFFVRMWSVLYVDTAKIPMFSFARIVEIFDKIPTNEKSNTPCILKACQLSSCSIVLDGTFFVSNTTDNSSSVLPIKQKSLYKSTCEKSSTLHIVNDLSIIYISINPSS